MASRIRTTLMDCQTIALQDMPITYLSIWKVQLMKQAKYFSANWCGPCKAFKPIIEELMKEGQPIEILDIDEHPHIAAEYNILSVPTTIILEDDKELERFVGAKTKQFVKNRLDIFVNASLSNET
jgi:thioredoxin-like negative regulator of GroEL